jgi:two-component system chemotaxis response regulator CheB
MKPGGHKIRVLLADDSAVMRSMLEKILASNERIDVVGTTTNGKEALAAFTRLRPDLVVLDVEMPIMDGLHALSKIRKIDRNVPVIMCSTLTQRGVQTTLEALSRGATDYVAKQGNKGINSGIQSLEQQLVNRILALFPQSVPGAQRVCATPRVHTPGFPLIEPRPELVVMGVSTGGPAALEVLLPALPASLPVPVLIVQHMPMQFTAQLAHRLSGLCAMRVREAVAGERPEAGVVHIARGDWHLELTSDLRMHLHQRIPENFCRPSVDVLFRSASIAFSERVLGVILTGMGSDGLEGCRAIRSAGGTVFAQDIESSVVWGMPGSVVQAGLANRVISLGAMALEIARFVSPVLQKSA